MPEYTLDEIEKVVPDKFKQQMLFGDTVERMRSIDPNHMIKTWIELDEVKRIFGDD